LSEWPAHFGSQWEKVPLDKPAGIIGPLQKLMPFLASRNKALISTLEIHDTLIPTNSY